MSLFKLAPTITDLPMDVIGLVFEYLPLSEVLLNQSLVCKAFYQAHLQHCRSSVKHLTLVGQQMVNIGGRRKKDRLLVAQSKFVHKLALFKIARSAGNSSTRTINPSTMHLKLIAGREDTAYEMIGRLFKSITHLELCQLPLERNYKQIGKMLTNWTTVGGSNQLTDFKIFFKKECFDSKGNPVDSKNKSPCFAYVFGKCLSPSVAPALKRVSIKSLDHVEAVLGPEFNHNDYEGPHNNNVDLSGIEAIDALGFSVSKQRGIDFDANGGVLIQQSKIRSLTVQLNCQATAVTVAIIKQLQSLIISFASFYGSYGIEYFKGTGGHLSSLTLKYVNEPFGKLMQDFIVPFTMTDGISLNHTLEHLRVDFEHRNNYQANINLNIRFYALTSLHLMQSNLLHSKKEMQELSVLFPNLVQLRLDGNYDARCFEDVKTSEDDCVYCREHIIVAVEQPNADEYLPLDIQFIDSSTAAICKDAFVCRAMAAWPQLVKVSLQIEDFYEHALKNGADLKYIFMSETIFLRDSATKKAVPEDEQVWKVEKVPF